MKKCVIFGVVFAALLTLSGALVQHFSSVADFQPPNSKPVAEFQPPNSATFTLQA